MTKRRKDDGKAEFRGKSNRSAPFDTRSIFPTKIAAMLETEKTKAIALVFSVSAQCLTKHCGCFLAFDI